MQKFARSQFSRKTPWLVLKTKEYRKNNKKSHLPRVQDFEKIKTEVSKLSNKTSYRLHFTGDLLLSADKEFFPQLKDIFFSKLNDFFAKLKNFFLKTQGIGNSGFNVYRITGEQISLLCSS